MSKSRIEKIRVTRNSTQKFRSLCGGVIIGDWLDQTTGERVLVVEKVSATRPAKKPKGKSIKEIESVEIGSA
jgi:hypothetical protein